MNAPEPFGLLVVDKPVGPTSHDVVQRVRKAADTRRVGHTGTLDPRASGMLVLCLGKATRLSEYLIEKPKRYLAQIEFGRTTTTYDGEGEVVQESGRAPDRDELAQALKGFQGRIEQRPPAYSAVRVQGQRAYDLSRRGAPPELAARPVTVYELNLRAYEPPRLELEVYCSAGTYIRSLAHDLGQAVGTGAYLSGLRRTQVGPFGLESAMELAALERSMERGGWRQHLLNPAAALPDVPTVVAQGETYERVRHGRVIAAEGPAEGIGRALDAEGNLIAILEATEDGLAWHPHKVFVD